MKSHDIHQNMFTLDPHHSNKPFPYAVSIGHGTIKVFSGGGGDSGGVGGGGFLALAFYIVFCKGPSCTEVCFRV